MNILYSFDTKFWMQAYASIYSLLKNKQPNTKYVIHCMVAPKTRGRRQISRIVKRAGCQLVWRKIRNDENPYRNADFARWSPVIFYRLFAHKIFPDAKRFIYLDSDTIILKDLTELYEIDLGKSVIGAIPDYGAILERDNHIKKLFANHMKTKQYINSGVLVIDCARMPDILDAKCELHYPDQDLINVALDGKIAFLPMCYNTIPGVHQDKINVPNPVIYHFYSVKPYYPSADISAYIMFENLIAELGLKPRDFIRQEERFTSTKTNVPFVKIHKNKLKVFGITVMAT